AGPTRGLAAPGDVEGGSASLREQLDAASKGFLDAQAAVKKSTQRQQELTTRLAAIEADLTTRNRTVGELADVAYRTGRLSRVSALLESGSPDGFLNRASRLGAVASNQDREVRALVETRDQAARAKTAIDQEILEQRKQVAAMAKRKQQAERALAANGGGGASAGVSGTSSSAAKAAPRNSDGSWPSESCSVNDPTTDGCITPRTLHAMNQAKAAGFTRFVSCHRDGGSGEHPKGRACDFAAQKGGFGGVASGGDRTYGNNLAAYFVKNADRLAVLYVIWFKQIWLPSSGWQAYTSGNGDPSSDHTNHVHLSVV
ncbi:coiled-coil domain-containing protein, partial [Micromonospora zhanjiangensis]